MAIVVVGHGSRDLEANREFEALVVAYGAVQRERNAEGAPARDLLWGYVELAEIGRASCRERVSRCV